MQQYISKILSRFKKSSPRGIITKRARAIKYLTLKFHFRRIRLKKLKILFCQKIKDLRRNVTRRSSKKKGFVSREKRLGNVTPGSGTKTFPF